MRRKARKVRELTVFRNYFVKDGYDQLLKGGSGGVVDDAILARLQYKTDVQSSYKQVSLDISGVVLKQGWEGL